MKKWTSLLLALAVALSLTACGNSGNQVTPPGAAGVRQRPRRRGNPCPRGHGDARGGPGGGARRE